MLLIRLSRPITGNMRMSTSTIRYFATCFLLVASAPVAALAQTESLQYLPDVEYEMVDTTSVAASNPLLWQQYQALQTGAPTTGYPSANCQGSCQSGGCQSGGCKSCGGGPADRCGCNIAYFPWFNGPGDCDNWCVGPKWDVSVDGIFLFRDEAELNLLTGATGDVFSYDEQFEHAPGARIFATAYNDCGYGFQVGYEGANDWAATRVFTNGTTNHTYKYESSINSLELNFLPNVPYTWKLLGGFRYVELSEDLLDNTTVPKPLVAPADPAPAPVTVNDTSLRNLLKNQLIGFQVGALRDNWNFGQRLTIEAFCNAGVYCNRFRREDVSLDIATTVYGDDTSTILIDESGTVVSTARNATRTNVAKIAFLGEAGLTSVLRVNQCLALRGGYQVMALDGVGQALDASLSPGLNPSTLLLHGMQFGLEYRR